MNPAPRPVLCSVVLLALGLASSSAFAATFNDVADGNWTDGATWGNASPGTEGVDFPGAADDAVVDSHSVTLSAGQSVSNVTVSGGTLSLGANSLTVRGAFTHTSGGFNGDTGKVVLANLQNNTLDVTGGTTFNDLQLGQDLSASGLKGYWKLDDGSGTSAADSSGGAALTLVNSDTDDWVAGAPGVPLETNPFALDFDDGADKEYGEITDASLPAGFPGKSGGSTGEILEEPCSRFQEVVEENYGYCIRRHQGINRWERRLGSVR